MAVPGGFDMDDIDSTASPALSYQSCVNTPPSDSPLQSTPGPQTRPLPVPQQMVNNSDTWSAQAQAYAHAQQAQAQAYAHAQQAQAQAQAQAQSQAYAPAPGSAQVYAQAQAHAQAQAQAQAYAQAQAPLAQIAGQHLHGAPQMGYGQHLHGAPQMGYGQPLQSAQHTWGYNPITQLVPHWGQNNPSAQQWGHNPSAQHAPPWGHNPRGYGQQQTPGLQTAASPQMSQQEQSPESPQLGHGQHAPQNAYSHQPEDHQQTVGSQSLQEQDPRALKHIDFANLLPSAKRRQVDLPSVQELGSKRRAVNQEPTTSKNIRREIDFQRQQVECAYDKTRSAVRSRKEKEVEVQNLQEQLHASRQIVTGLKEMTNDEVALRNTLVQNHQQEMAKMKDEIEKMRDEHRKTLEVQKAQWEKEAQAQRDKELEKERAVNETRLAAIAAREIRAGSSKDPSDLRSQVARKQELLQSAKRELKKHPNLILTAEGPIESDSEDTMDEDVDGVGALAWVHAQMEKERRKKKRNDDPPPPSKKRLDRARKNQQNDLSHAQDKLWKRAARVAVGKATGFWNQKDYKNYKPVKQEIMQACADGMQRPDDKQIVFYFGKGYEKCLWNRILLERLVDQTIALRAEGEFAGLPAVSKDYVQALLFNVLKGGYDEWSRHQQKGGETPREARARMEEWQDYRRLQTMGDSRKARKKDARVKTAEMMRKVKAQEGDVTGTRIFERAIDIVNELGNTGMSSEEEAARTTYTRDGRKKKRTVLVIRRLGWRADIPTKNVLMLDTYRKAQKNAGQGGYDRVRIRQESQSAAPPGLLRNLYDDEWIKNQKAFDQDIENTLDIRPSKFKMVDIGFNGFSDESDWDPDEDAGNDADMDVDGRENEGDAGGGSEDVGNGSGK